MKDLGVKRQYIHKLLLSETEKKKTNVVKY